MNKVKIVAICGSAGSGKDWLLHQLVELSNGQLHEIISTTTRPKREGEQNGVHYHFVSDENFAQLVFSNSMLEATSFNGWYYGTCFDALDIKETNIGVFNPDGIRALLDDPRIEVLPIQVLCDSKTRLIRQLQREPNPNCDEIIRRYQTDKMNFMSVDFETLPYLNNDSSSCDKPLDIIEYLQDRHWLDKND